MTSFEHGLSVLQGDITRLAVDAIVNAANSTLLGGGGVDGAIHRSAGPELREQCSTLGGCPTGEARITRGFRLPARHVIHTVGPKWHGGDHGEAALLAACYRNVFALVSQHRIETIAFPAISCGAYGFPKGEAAEIAISCCREALDGFGPLRSVILVAFDADMAELYRGILQNRPSNRESSDGSVGRAWNRRK